MREERRSGSGSLALGSCRAGLPTACFAVDQQWRSTPPCFACRPPHHIYHCMPLCVSSASLWLAMCTCTITNLTQVVDGVFFLRTSCKGCRRWDHPQFSWDNISHILNRCRRYPSLPLKRAQSSSKLQPRNWTILIFVQVHRLVLPRGKAPRSHLRLNHFSRSTPRITASLWLTMCTFTQFTCTIWMLGTRHAKGTNMDAYLASHFRDVLPL